MKVIEQEIARIEIEIDRLTREREALLRVKRLSEGEVIEPEQSTKRRSRRGEVNEAVLHMVDISADVGITANECVRQATDRGYREDTVRSLLSRLKSEGKLFFDGDRYRLKKYAGPRSAA